jgi:hypothetical protein
MSDILADYREWRDQQAARVSTHSDRCHMWHRDCMIHRLADALERATLTDEEREAVAYCVSCAQDYRETLDCCEQSEKYDRATRMIDAAMRLVILTVGHAPVERLGATKVTDADGAGPT